MRKVKKVDSINFNGNSAVKSSVSGLTEGAKMNSLEAVAALDHALRKHFGHSMHEPFQLKVALEKAYAAGKGDAKLMEAANDIKADLGINGYDFDGIENNIAATLRNAILSESANSSLDLFAPQYLSTLMLVKVYQESIFKNLVNFRPMEGPTKTFTKNIPYFILPDGSRVEFDDFANLVSMPEKSTSDVALGDSINLISTFSFADVDIDKIEVGTIKIKEATITMNDGTVDKVVKFAVVAADGISNEPFTFAAENTKTQTAAVKLIPVSVDGVAVDSYAVTAGELILEVAFNRESSIFHSAVSSLLSGVAVNIVVGGTAADYTYVASASNVLTVEAGFNKELLNRNTTLKFEQVQYTLAAIYRTIELNQTYREMEHAANLKAQKGLDVYKNLLDLVSGRFALDMDWKVLGDYAEAIRKNVAVARDLYLNVIDSGTSQYKDLGQMINDMVRDIKLAINKLMVNAGMSGATPVLVGPDSFRASMNLSNILKGEGIEYVSSPYIEDINSPKFFNVSDALGGSAVDGVTDLGNGARLMLAFKGNDEASMVGVYGAFMNRYNPKDIELNLRQHSDVFVMEDNAAILRPEALGQLTLSFKVNN